MRENFPGHQNIGLGEMCVSSVRHPSRGRPLCVSVEIIGYLRQSKTEQNHLSPTGRVGKTENSKHWDRMCRVLEPLGVGLGTGTTALGGSPKSKAGWAYLACMRPWIPSQHHIN